MGAQSGRIRDARTMVLAYCMDEDTLLPLIVNVVKGRMAEENALVFMERVIDFAQRNRVKRNPYRRRHA